jgi:hypothetical protein
LREYKWPLRFSILELRENRLVEVVWAYNTTWKITTPFTPYALVYGIKEMFSK